MDMCFRRERPYTGASESTSHRSITKPEILNLKGCYRECSLDESCVLCVRCYKASDHEGHEVSFSMHSGGCGCCDCGDHEAWKRELDCAYHHETVPYPDDIEENQREVISLPVPAELITFIRFRVQEAVDFIIQAMSLFPHATEAPHSPRTISSAKPEIPLRPFENPEASTDYQGPWSVILWNDENHIYYQVIEQLVSSTRCSRSHAYAAACRVDSYGLEVIATSTDATNLWRIAQKIARIGLGVTVCTSRDAVMLEAVGLLLEWLQDMVKVRMGGDEIVLGRVVAEVLLQNGRLASLLKLEDRLWKRARASLRNILMGLLVVGQDCKIELGVQYASVYPALISSYLLTDREPDNSVTQFSVQLFSAPSVATHLVTQHEFLITLLQILYSFFTQQHRGPNGEKAIFYPPLADHGPVDPESTSFKHKRYFQVFHDLNYLMAHPGVRQHLADQKDSSFNILLAFLNLFSGMNPLTRASSVHVEYETDSWVTAFNLTIQLSKLAKIAGKAFHPDPHENHLSHTVSPSYFIETIMQLVVKMHKQLAPADEWGQPKTPCHTVSFASKEWQTVRYRISDQPVSFHHPLHLLYAEMMKNLSNWTDQQVAENTSGYRLNFSSLVARIPTQDQNIFFRVMDEVLRGLYSILLPIHPLTTMHL